MLRLVNRFNRLTRFKTDLVLAKWVAGELEEAIFKTTNTFTDSEENKVNYLISIKKNHFYVLMLYN